ncbi:MAG: GTP-binding protein [Candidatus Lokiarchaeota archaeon]|nr:GTP-binding protein [Candidatus Lokiarchaeota archaeon]
MANLILKVLILGTESVGKTNFKTIADKYFETDYKPVVGVNVLTKTVTVEIEGRPINTIISLWDISGKTRFDEIRKLFYKGGVGALFVFNLNKSSSWFHVIECYKEIEVAIKNIPFIVIGNLEKHRKSKVDIKEVIDWVEEHGGYFVQIDPENSSLLETTFENLITEILSSLE